MSKWALWAAHRYVRAGAAAPRRVGADGRLLQRPWRLVSPAAEQRVRLLRAARPQPAWPRLLGVLCLLVACMFAVDPVGPMPTHVAASSSARTAPGLASPAGLEPAGRTTVPAQFRWRAGASRPPFTLVLLDAGYGEVLRRDGIEATAWATDAGMRRVLQRGGAFHWYVLGDGLGRPLASPLATLEID